MLLKRSSVEFGLLVLLRDIAEMLSLDVKVSESMTASAAVES